VKLTLAILFMWQESSLFLGLSYVISSVSIFDEYTNDVLDMAPGSCFPRYKWFILYQNVVLELYE